MANKTQPMQVKSSQSAIALLASLGIGEAPERKVNAFFAPKVVHPLTPQQEQILLAVDATYLSQGKEALIPHRVFGSDYSHTIAMWLVGRGYNANNLGTGERYATVRNFRNGGRGKDTKAESLIIEPRQRKFGRQKATDDGQ